MSGTWAKTDGQSIYLGPLHVAWLPRHLATSRCYREQTEAASPSMTQIQKSHSITPPVLYCSSNQCPPRNKGKGMRLFPSGGAERSYYRTRGSETFGNFWKIPFATDTSRGQVSLSCVERGPPLNSIRKRTRQFASGMNTGLQAQWELLT